MNDREELQALVKDSFEKFLVFHTKCDYADLEYLSEAIYENLFKYSVDNPYGMDMEDIVAGKFEISVTWRKE